MDHTVMAGLQALAEQAYVVQTNVNKRKDKVIFFNDPNATIPIDEGKIPLMNHFKYSIKVCWFQSSRLFIERYRWNIWTTTRLKNISLNTGFRPLRTPV